MKLKTNTANIPAAQTVDQSDTFHSPTSTGYVSAIPEVVRPPIPSAVESGATVIEADDLSSLSAEDKQSGRLISHRGKIYRWDQNLSRCLSTNRLQFLLGREGDVKNMYLRVASVFSNRSTYQSPPNAVLTGFAVMASEALSDDATVSVYADGVSIKDAVLQAGDQQHTETNIAISIGQTAKKLSVFVGTEDRVISPVVAIEIAQEI